MIFTWQRNHADLHDTGEIMSWLKPIRYIWAFPSTFIGLLLVPFAVALGGNARVVEGVLEVHGGVVTWLLRRGLPFVGPGAAMALGHVVLGRDPDCLTRSRAHERIHVRQYERWGPFLIPVYLLVSLYLYLRGRDPYLDNPFEQEAFDNE